MRICREYQRELLNKMGEAHPDHIPETALVEGLDHDGFDRLVGNLIYLEEHGLIVSGLRRLRSNQFVWNDGPRITARGLDFLADDGGLTAILGTVTIKFHDETLRALIASKIESSDLDQQEKSKLLTGLQELPAESIKHLTMRLLDKGLESLPSALPILQTALQGLL